MIARRRLLASALLAVFAAIAVPQAAAATAADAVAFVEKTGRRAIDTLTSKSISDEERIERFRKIFRSAFNVRRIARFVLGRYWRRATEAQREEYVQLFEEFVIQAYANRFKSYSGEAFVVTTAQPVGKRDHLVLSELVNPGKKPVLVKWRLRATKDGFEIIDVIVARVSMILTQRDEFAAVILENGGTVEGLLRVLRRRTGMRKS
jgi:phospholipid transport system substrate-binding protein